MRRLFPGIIIVVAMSLLIGWLARSNGFGAVSAESYSAERALNVLAVAAFVALIIERSVEVILTARYTEREQKVLQPVERLEKLIEALDNRRLTLVGNTADAATLAAADVEIQRQKTALADLTKANEAERTAIVAEKTHDAIVVSLVLGFLAALVGFQIMEQIFDAPATDATGETSTPPDGPTAQQYFFFAFDLVVTATLLAGGADVIHSLMKAIKGEGTSLKATRPTS